MADGVEVIASNEQRDDTKPTTTGSNTKGRTRVKSDGSKPGVKTSTPS